MGGSSSRELTERGQSMQLGQPQRCMDYGSPFDSGSPMQFHGNRAQFGSCENFNSAFASSPDRFHRHTNNLQVSLGSHQYRSMEGFHQESKFFSAGPVHGGFEVPTFRRPLPQRHSFSDDYFGVQNPSPTFSSQARSNSLFELNDRTQFAAGCQGLGNLSRYSRNSGSYNRASRSRGSIKISGSRFRGAKRKFSGSNNNNTDISKLTRENEDFWRDVKDEDLHEFEEPRVKRRRSEGSTHSLSRNSFTICSNTGSHSSTDVQNDSQTHETWSSTSGNNKESVDVPSSENNSILLRASKILSFPSNWSSNYSNYGRTNYVEIMFSSREGRLVQNFFNRSALSPSKFNPFELCIASIVRVESPFLHSMYLLKKEEMMVRNGHVDELFLYHGTKEKHVDKICEDNVDWRLCNEKKHLFGRGVSFSTQAHYASHYSDHTNVKVMVLFKVLVSNSVLGSQDMIIPPIESGVSFDTSIKEDTRVIVKYFDNEFYPLYKIFYTKHAQNSL